MRASSRPNHGCESFGRCCATAGRPRTSAKKFRRERSRWVSAAFWLAFRNKPYFPAPSPVNIQSMGLPENALSLSRISTVGALRPSSYFETWVCGIPSSRPNSAWVRSKPRISLILRPIAFRSTGARIFLAGECARTAYSQGAETVTFAPTAQNANTLGGQGVSMERHTCNADCRLGLLVPSPMPY